MGSTSFSLTDKILGSYIVDLRSPLPTDRPVGVTTRIDHFVKAEFVARFLAASTSVFAAVDVAIHFTGGVVRGGHLILSEVGLVSRPVWGDGFTVYHHFVQATWFLGVMVVGLIGFFVIFPDLVVSLPIKEERVVPLPNAPATAPIVSEAPVLVARDLVREIQIGHQPRAPKSIYDLIWLLPCATKEEIDHVFSLYKDNMKDELDKLYNGNTVLFLAINMENNNNPELISKLLEHNAPYKLNQPEISVEEAVGLLEKLVYPSQVLSVLLNKSNHVEELLKHLKTIASDDLKLKKTRMALSAVLRFYEFCKKEIDTYVQPALSSPELNFPVDVVNHVILQYLFPFPREKQAELEQLQRKQMASIKNAV